MNPQGVINQLDNCIMALTKGNIELKTLGLKKAQTERDYRIKYNQKILELKAEKCQATLIIALAKSNPEVAELAMKRDIAESSYYVALDAINNLRSEIEILRSKLAWLKTELRNS
jgi:hypothetical protein